MGLLRASVEATDQITIKKTTVFRIGYMVTTEYDKIGYATTAIFSSEAEARLYAQPGEGVVEVEIRQRNQ